LLAGEYINMFTTITRVLQLLVSTLVIAKRGV